MVKPRVRMVPSLGLLILPTALFWFLSLVLHGTAVEFATLVLGKWIPASTTSNEGAPEIITQFRMLSDDELAVSLAELKPVE